MQAGKLRHRVTIERRTLSTPSATGARTMTWAKVDDRWAEVRPLSGRELYTARQVQANTTHAIRMRADSVTTTITAKDRIKFGSRIFEIADAPINTNERGAEITFTCTETAAT